MIQLFDDTASYFLEPQGSLLGLPSGGGGREGEEKVLSPVLLYGRGERTKDKVTEEQGPPSPAPKRGEQCLCSLC